MDEVGVCLLFSLPPSTPIGSWSLCITNLIWVLDQEDEALNRWKASLGLATGDSISDPNDPRSCIIKSLALVGGNSSVSFVH